MDNSTEQQTSLVTEETNTKVLVFLIILILILCLHVAVQWCIFKARLHNNNFYLIRALSSVDSLAILWVIFFGILRDLEVTLNPKILSIILSSFFHSSYSMSLVITMLIVTDRWIAMQFTLRYHVLVTKRKINIAILISSFILVTIYITLLFLDTTSNQQKHQTIDSNQYTLVFFGHFEINNLHSYHRFR